MGHNMLPYLSVIHAWPQSWASDWSEELEFDAAQDNIAPNAPGGFALQEIPAGITLTWTKPTINVDGSTCRDVGEFAVYRKAGSGSIDPDNPSSYDKRTLVGLQESYTYPTTNVDTTYYFVVTALDKTGNESASTAELSGSPSAVEPTADIPDDASGLIFDDSIGGDGVVSGYAMLGVAFVAPNPDWLNFERYRLYYQYTTDGSTWRDEGGTADQWTELPCSVWGYLHKGLDQTGARAYRYKAIIRAKDGTESSTADTAGGASTTADAADNSSVVAVTIFAQNIVCLGEVRAASILAGEVSASKLASDVISGGKIIAGLLTASNIQAGTLNCSLITVTNLSASSITTGSLSATRISGGTLNFGAISRSALSIIATEIGSSQVKTGYNHIDFTGANLSAVGQDIYNITGLRGYTSSSSHWLDLRNDAWYGASTSSYVYLGSNASIRAASSLYVHAQNGDVYVRATSGYAILQWFYPSYELKFQGGATSGGRWSNGYINVIWQGESRRIQLDPQS